MNDVLCQFVSAQSQEDGLAKLIVTSPLGKLDLGDQHGFDPVAAFHDGRVMPWPHLPLDFSGKLIKGQVARLSFCNCASILARSFSEKPEPTLPANKSPSGPW
jgi:hypothetical protein